MVCFSVNVYNKALGCGHFQNLGLDWIEDTFLQTLMMLVFI
jgi:hypothetical protein